MKYLKLALAILIAAVMLSSAIPTHAETRADKVGWQMESFDENVNLTYNPKAPTPSEPVVVRIASRDPKVFIQVAYVYLTIQMPSTGAITTGLTFSRTNETVMTCTLSAYPNGTLVRFYINALDYFNVPAISGNYSYTVMGQDRPGGWVHSTFNKNLNLTWRPTVPNATEPARVSIRSLDGVGIYGAYLYVTYEVKVGQPQSGGYPFQRTNDTAMWCDIPGYPMGTNVRFWASAWDKYNNLTISGYYNYSIPQEEDYSNHAFVGFDGLGAIVGLIAFAAVGAFAFLRVLDAERKRKLKGTSYGQIELQKMKDARERADGLDGKPKEPKTLAEPGKIQTSQVRKAVSDAKTDADKAAAPEKTKERKGLFGRPPKREVKK